MPPAWSHRSLQLSFLFILLLALFRPVVSSTECSATQLCASGCCSKFGFCGFSDEHCGSGCLSTCDAKPEEDTNIGGGGECSASIPCKNGCCSKYGNCGFGEEYCSVDQGCVNNCGLKSECDAGWGLDWAERKTCPLSVCCSKYGFCGTTEEFCGEDDKIERPSCDAATGKIDRVVGYFEQWSIKRQCEWFAPEMIPAGYYTHVNFAFASINPTTFEIVEAEPWDDVLWERMRSLRLEQPGVEIWVALGGWLFNDPDQPTKTTFSDIAKSEDKQKTFAKSLLAMMSKYGFDGVDIDWEYPVAEERSGRREDFDNFPKWMRNLRSQLKSSGKKYGLSLTLPASYWYLQHFDIKRLEESVDWFNVMSYDMHGTWDQNNTWVGPFLNPHTNLTEIKGAMDLLWRNDIAPAKVTLGLAYYGRSFTLSSPDCSEPGCTYLSGGNAGKCSDTVGFLLNSEIQTIINENNLSPKFYKEDAVKAIHWGNQWVSYDDADTFKIRGDFAKSQCLGGVMVWAISHDDQNSTSAEGLMSGLGKKRMPFPSYSAATTAVSKLGRRDDSADSNVDVCRWTNCGENCPSGWKWIRREDSDSLSMTDETLCFAEQDSRKFCCPGDVALPKCQWRGMPKHGGNCSPGCNDGEVEVGTLGYPYCQTKHQSACCTVTPSTSPYGECKWVGSAGLCSSSGGHKDCPSDYPTFVFASSNGAGGEQTCTQGAKSYCCKGEVPWQFKKCSWQKKATHYIKLDSFCESSCPEGQTKLGMHAGTCRGWGFEAYCCAGDPPKEDDDAKEDDDEESTPTVEPRDPNHLYYSEYEALIEQYMDYPGAPSDFHSYSWAPDRDEALMRRGVLNLYDYKLYNAYNARTMESKVQKIIDLYTDTGPPTKFGDQFQIPQMNERIHQSGNTIDRYAYVSDLMANPYTADVALDYMDTATDDLCTLDDDSSTDYSKRETPEWGRPDDENDVKLAKRHINVVDISTEDDAKMNGQPTMRTILRGIRNGDLSLHYARWEHYTDRTQHGRRAGPLLEVAYWIGSEIGTLGANAERYQETEQDKWVVFHFHYGLDGLMAHRKGKDLPKWYFGCTSITVFHGQTLEYPRNRFSDNRVDGRDSTRGESHNGANSRSRALQCPIGRRWYIAEATVPSAAGNHYYASELAEFARTLYDQGYIGALGFRQIFERTGNSQFGPDGYQRYGDAMNRNFIIKLQETAPGWEEWVTREIGDIHDGSSSS